MSTDAKSLPTTADDFDGAPPPQSFFNPSNHGGALALFVPKQFVANKEFPFGVKDCTVSAVWIIQGEGAGCFWAAAEVAGVKMCSQLSGKIGGKVLGRIVKEPGSGNRPYVIAQATESDRKAASEWLNARNNRAEVERNQRAAGQATESVPNTTSSTPPVAITAGTPLPPPPPVTVHDAPPY